METVLIVDDNDRYANNLKTYLDKRNIASERAITASQGYEMFLASQYTTIISDITMETQTSGLVFIRKIFKIGFKGKIIIATTGFDVWGVMFLGKYLLPYFGGVGWMIPKVPLKKGEVLFYPTILTKSIDPFDSP
jgi:two-component SAPR family response regulator